MEIEPQPLAYSPEQACRALSIKKSNLYNLIRAGKIRTVKLGRRTLLPVDGPRGLRSLLEGEV